MNIIRHYGRYLVRYLRETRGVMAMEYAIIIGVVVVGVGAAVAAFQTDITAFLENVSTDLTKTRASVSVTPKK